MTSSAVVSKLSEWLDSNGTADSLLEIQYLNPYEGHGVFAKQSLARGQVTLQIPFKLTMNIESAAAQSDLAVVLEAYPQIPPDEVLALHLMHERSKGKGSFFAPFIASLPTTFDLPVFWSDAELNELQGTNVLLLTQLMQQQLARDFTNIHQQVTKDFPEIFASLPTLTLEDYTWAMSVIWSRAFGVNKDGKYLRLLCPAMDMFNHDVTLQNPLDDFVSFDEEKQVMVHHVPTDVLKGSAVHISYGQYSNAKLLYSYGFVAHDNPRRGVDFWVKIPPTDPYMKLKQGILDTNDLTREQTYDFCGTLFRTDVDERLLATLRVILMNEQEIRLYGKAFESSSISARNELAVYDNLQSACRRKLKSFPTSLEEDEAILEDAMAKSSFRLSLAVRVRIEDKQVFAGVIDTIEQWKHVLVTCPEKYPPSTTRS